MRQVVAAAAGVATPSAAQVNANTAAADPTRFRIFPTVVTPLRIPCADLGVLDPRVEPVGWRTLSNRDKHRQCPRRWSRIVVWIGGRCSALGAIWPVWRPSVECRAPKTAGWSSVTARPEESVRTARAGKARSESSTYVVSRRPWLPCAPRAFLFAVAPLPSSLRPEVRPREERNRYGEAGQGSRRRGAEREVHLVGRRRADRVPRALA